MSTIPLKENGPHLDNATRNKMIPLTKDKPKKQTPVLSVGAFSGESEMDHPAVPPSVDLLEYRKKYKVDLSMPLQPQPIALEVIGKSYSAPIACYGGLTLVTAKAKSGKTFAHTILVSALIKGGELFGRIRPHFNAKDSNRRKVIVFDTEQSDYHAQKVGKRIAHLARCENPSNLEVWKLRTEPNNVKKDIIEKVIYADPEVCAIVIDGGRDTIFDINSSEEGARASTELIKWAEELGIAIIVILHQNKADNNARGHYGTELKNKSEIIVNVTKDKESGIYTIEPEDCRDREFEPIAFKIDDDGIPYLVDSYLPLKEVDGKRQKLNANNIPDEQHRQILAEIFQKAKRPKYSELQTQIKLSFQVFGISFGDNRAVEFMTYYKNKGWITENEDRLPGEKCTTYHFA